MNTLHRENFSEALSKVEERNRLLVQSLQEGLFVIQDGKFTFLNEAIGRIVDFKVDELLGKNFLLVIAPEYHELITDNYLRRLRGESVPGSYEAKIIKKDGITRVPVILSLTLSTFDGKPAVIGTAKDITELKEAEAKIREREVRLNAIFENAIVGIAVGGPDGRLIQCNAYWHELFGYTREEMLRMSSQDISLADDQPATDKMLEALNSGEIDHYHLEKRYRKKDGSVFWGHVSVNAIRNEDGKFESLVATLFDLTRRKTVEEELLHTQELLRSESRQLKEDNLRSQFDALKNQVNPHFLFNSLNVLISLIRLDPALAEKFTEQLAKVYRYVLEHREDDLVPLRSEFDFINSYVFLLEIRFMDKVKVNITIPEYKMDLRVLPLAAQLMIENAVKHNTFSKKNPLFIEIFIDSDNYMNIENNLQKRAMHIESTGVGLVNVAARLKHLTEKPPFFGEINGKFSARIPLLITD